MELNIEDISHDSVCRIQKRKQVSAIVEYIKQYNEENDGLIKIMHCFDSNFNNVSIAWVGAINEIEAIDIDEFFIEMFKDNR